MAYTAIWDETTPTGVEDRSLGDDRIRELKIQLRQRLEEFLISDMDADPVTPKTVVTLASGTKMVFFQSAAPTGWTKSTTHNDKMLRVVNTAGGGEGGSTGIAAGLAAHTHTGPSHTHGNNQAGAMDGNSLSIYSSGPYYIPYGTSMPNTAAGGTGNTGSGGAWAPYYIDVIICTKD